MKVTVKEIIFDLKTSYKGHSINETSFCLMSWQLEVLFTVPPFSRKFIVISPIIYKKTVNITFTDHCAWNFSLQESQCVSCQWAVFLTQAHGGKPMFSPFVNIF